MTDQDHEHHERNMDSVMEKVLAKDSGQFVMPYRERQLYLQVVNEMKANIRDVPLAQLIQLIGETGNTKRVAPREISMERKVAIFAAKREIHRRAIEGFTVIPSRKCDVSGLGFLRKPKY